MERWLKTAPERPVTELVVDVTFLERTLPPEKAVSPWPEEYRLERWQPEIDEYLGLYRRVGAPHCWWMRYMMAPEALRLILISPQTAIYCLSKGTDRIGFFELDLHRDNVAYLSYLGLVPEAQGKGLGRTLLRTAISMAWGDKTQMLRVNTCTADHPHALSAYKAAGFVPVSVQTEHWLIPDDLGLTPPVWMRKSRIAD